MHLLNQSSKASRTNESVAVSIKSGIQITKYKKSHNNVPKYIANIIGKIDVIKISINNIIIIKIFNI